MLPLPAVDSFSMKRKVLIADEWPLLVKVPDLEIQDSLTLYDPKTRMDTLNTERRDGQVRLKVGPSVTKILR